jgi:hypothetical protein
LASRLGCCPPGGRVGAIALAATGVAAAYIDVIAVTTIYDWVSAPVGLVIAAAIGGGGLTLARRWDSQHLGLLVLVPLSVLAPIVTDGITMLLIAFMLAISAASLLVQLGKDWILLHTARITASTFPLLVALAVAHFGDDNDAWLAGACGIAAMLAIVGALILLPSTGNRVAMALLTTAACPGAVRIGGPRADGRRIDGRRSGCGAARDRARRGPPACRLQGRPTDLVGTSAVSALIAVTVAFDGEVAAPVLLAMAAVVAVAGRRDDVARFVAVGFGSSAEGYTSATHRPPRWSAPRCCRHRCGSGPHGVARCRDRLALILSTEFVASEEWALNNQSWPTTLWATNATISAAILLGPIYGMLSGVVVVAASTVAKGVLNYDLGRNATVVIELAVGLGVARLPRDDRSLPIAGGLALVAAAMAKLFLFDLGTLDGMFRVAVFIVVGLVLLGMGAGYARLLAQQDQQQV